jgi:hypothetical protein
MVPKEMLRVPVRLELDKTTMEVRAGSTVTYTVTLKNAQNQVVSAMRDLRLEIETPSGTQEVTLPSGKSSTTFNWQANRAGVATMKVRSGKLHPADGLVLVEPAPRAKLEVHPILPEPARVEIEKKPVEIAKKKMSGHPHPGVTIEHPAGEAAPPPPPPAPVEAAAPASGTAQAKKIQIYVNPLPVFGNALERSWTAKVSIAAVDDNNQIVPVASPVQVHFNTGVGSISPADIVLAPGTFSNFEAPAILTARTFGKDQIQAISSLGTAGPVEVDYLLPPATQLRLSLGTPQLLGNGSSSAEVEVCLADEAEAPATLPQDIGVMLTAAGQLSKSVATITHGVPCGEALTWVASKSGLAQITAEAGGLQKAAASVIFPAFPWYLVWLAALGGVIGTLVVSSDGVFSAQWLAHTWRNLVLAAVLGAIFYLFARFGAISLPKDSPVNLQNIPVVSGIGSFLLGFLGGLYGRKLWKVDEA